MTLDRAGMLALDASRTTRDRQPGPASLHHTTTVSPSLASP